jgi:hypothetical protein
MSAAVEKNAAFHFMANLTFGGKELSADTYILERSQQAKCLKQP